MRRMYSASFVFAAGFTCASVHLARTHLSMSADPDSLSSVFVSWAKVAGTTRTARMPMASVRMLASNSRLTERFNKGPPDLLRQIYFTMLHAPSDVTQHFPAAMVM